ncbi:hypothetical protein HaLaN_05177 [Haematococcus lacustris]|uniref:Uncharacterized protein n=1 Tax=Haematococcus lacustris TaxID=44745 RepID=A0A699YT10_HAELA|nr:hypothetical protein HaLaN_05177 [Haematococcus lacustris]
MQAYTWDGERAVHSWAALRDAAHSAVGLLSASLLLPDIGSAAAERGLLPSQHPRPAAADPAE